MEWLAEMYIRVSEGKPPLTESEYQELEDWFHRHKAVLPLEDHRAVRHGVLRGPDGRERPIERTYEIDDEFFYGPRGFYATIRYEHLRELRAAHPELE
jgi:hypothetical protein